MQELKLSNKDAAIHRSNPGKDPYTLKELGLSQKGFDKLMAMGTLAVTAIADPTITDAPAEPPTSKDQGVVNIPGESIPPVSAPPVTTPALIPKVTSIGDSLESFPTEPNHKGSIILLPGQVAVTNLKGVTVAMGIDFANRLKKFDGRYIINP